MIERSNYSYSLLKYIHDTSTGEFANVALAMLCPDKGFLKIKFRRSAGRISDIFPDLQSLQFKRTLRLIERQYQAIVDAWLSPLEFNCKENNLSAILLSGLPKDDSSLCWGDISNGITKNANQTFDRLFEKYVGKYDRVPPKKGRSDEDIWKVVRRELEERCIYDFFSEKTIHGKNDEVQFDLAWKNGVWHCISPLSFDLSAPETIREKAHRRAGEILGVLDSEEEFKVYFIVGEPKNPALTKAYEKAVGIFGNIPAVEVFSENEKSQLIDRINLQIINHQEHASN